MTLLALLLTLGTTIAAPQTKQETVDVTGAWVLQVETAAGGGSPTFTFTQKGEKLEGDYSGAFGTAKVTGTVKGTTVAFWFEADVQGTRMQIRYDGTVEKDSMKGTVTFGDLGDGTFTGSRKK